MAANLFFFLKVSICSGCDAMYPWAASVTGIGAGIAYVILQTIIPRLGLDDSLDTVARKFLVSSKKASILFDVKSILVHGGGGTWGLFATAIFDRKRGIVYLWNKTAFLVRHT